jgi:RNA polymerase sigma factor for flagellar operon FliA
MSHTASIKESAAVTAAAVDREAFIQEFAPQIKYIAYRLAMRLPPHIEVNELINAGVIGLIDALDRYDPSRDVKFKTYAEFRIRGAMLDELRSLDWVPRSVRRKATVVERTMQELERRLGRAPTEEEMAGAMGMEADDYLRFLQDAAGSAIISVEDLHGHDGEDRDLFETIADPAAADPLEQARARETKQSIAKAIDRLPAKERLVVSLYYFEELTMKEIAAVLEVTESRVSQIHSQAVLRLRGRLKSFMAGDA